MGDKESEFKMSIYDMIKRAATNYEVINDILRIYGTATKTQQKFLEMQPRNFAVLLVPR